MAATFSPIKQGLVPLQNAKATARHFPLISIGATPMVEDYQKRWIRKTGNDGSDLAVFADNFDTFDLQNTPRFIAGKISEPVCWRYKLPAAFTEVF